MNKYFILIIVLIIGIIFTFIIKEVKSAEKNKHTIEMQKIINNQQEEVIEVKNDIIKTKNYQQKLINKDSSSDIIKREQWLQLVYTKRENSLHKD